MISHSVCQHCGSPVPAGRTDAFCCAGCAYVHDLLVREGFDRFYDLRGLSALPPVSPQALRDRDYEWLETLVKEAEAREGGYPDLRLSVQGLSCIGCVWLTERVFARHPGGIRIVVDVVQGELRLTWQRGRFDAVAFARDLQAFGYLLGPARADSETKQASDLGRRMAVCGAFAMNAMAFSLPSYFGMPPDFVFAPWFDMITAVSATLALLVGGSYFVEKSWRSLRAGMLHIDTPIALGIVTAYLGSVAGWVGGVSSLRYFDFVAIFIFLMLLGRWTQQAALEKNRRRLMRDTSVPDHVAAVDGSGRVSPRPLAALRRGDRFEWKRGQTIPVASRLLSPEASISLEWINGESDAQVRKEAQLIPSGALNIGEAALQVEAVEAWENSTLRRLLESRREEGFRDQRLEAILRWYLAIVVAIGLVAAAVWWWRGAGISQALQVMISIFVVSCPCALGVAVPLAEELAVARASRLGVFVRTHGFWKRLLRIRRVVFDKTGTLTLENPSLQNPEALLALNADAKAALRTLVSGNLHPVSRSLFDEVGPGPILAGDVTETVGQGLRLQGETGTIWTLARPGHAQPDDVVFKRDHAVVAGFRFAEALRPESVAEVCLLRQRHLEVNILSGDRESKVAHVAEQLNLPAEAWRSGLSPEEKAAWIQARDQGDTLYIGDGANDSLAFDAALCAGSPVGGRSFLEQKADFYFLGHNLRFVSALLTLATVHRRAVRRVFAFSVIYNLGAIAAGCLGHMNPLAAAVLMPLSSLVTLTLVSVTFRASRQPFLTTDGIPKRIPAWTPRCRDLLLTTNEAKPCLPM